MSESSIVEVGESEWEYAFKLVRAFNEVPEASKQTVIYTFLAFIAVSTAPNANMTPVEILDILREETINTIQINPPETFDISLNSGI